MNTADILALPARALDILKQIEKWKTGAISQSEASRTLKLSERHFRRLIRSYESQGIKGLISLRHGKAPSNKIDDITRCKSLSLIQEHFYDYGPTLAAEKLAEYFGIRVSKETVHQWMIQDNLWKPHFKHLHKSHPSRPRRPFLGELVQVDGSHHHWFENRGAKACLLVFIDDATGKLLHLRFAPGETTIDYLTMLKEYVLEQGVPRAMYFDKHNVFHINQKTAQAKDGFTQFGRVMKYLNIQPIYAHSPQAKGRVERVNATLQDRLLKELRFFDISNIHDANKHLPSFIKRFNDKFSVLPEEPSDLHRPLSEQEKQSLDFHCSIQTTKTITKDLLVKHNKQVLKIIRNKQSPKNLIKQKIILCEDYDGIKIFINNIPLNYEIIKKSKTCAPTLNRKNMEQFLDNNPNFKGYWMLLPQ